MKQSTRQIYLPTLVLVVCPNCIISPVPTSIGIGGGKIHRIVGDSPRTGRQWRAVLLGLVFVGILLGTEHAREGFEQFRIECTPVIEHLS